MADGTLFIPGAMEIFKLHRIIIPLYILYKLHISVTKYFLFQ
jgi:hypothetical protein